MLNKIFNFFKQERRNYIDLESDEGYWDVINDDVLHRPDMKREIEEALNDTLLTEENLVNQVRVILNDQDGNKKQILRLTIEEFNDLKKMMKKIK